MLGAFLKSPFSLALNHILLCIPSMAFIIIGKFLVFFFHYPSPPWDIGSIKQRLSLVLLLCPNQWGLKSGSTCRVLVQKGEKNAFGGMEEKQVFMSQRYFLNSSSFRRNIMLRGKIKEREWETHTLMRSFITWVIADVFHCLKIFPTVDMFYDFMVL